MKIDRLAELAKAGVAERMVARQSAGQTPQSVADELLSLDPVMRDLMNAARPGYGTYTPVEDVSADDDYASGYWTRTARPPALRAMGIHQLWAEAREKMRPDSPDISAEQFHHWVWEAAMPMWNAGSGPDAVHAAARSVNARLQQKLDRHDISEADICRQAFSKDPPIVGKPRLRFPGDRGTDTWKSRQQGAMDFGAGCFEAIRNPAAHEHQLHLPEQIALEQLAALSLLARWIEECEVESAGPVTTARQVS